MTALDGFLAWASVHNQAGSGERLSKREKLLQQERERYRIEADCAISEYDWLEDVARSALDDIANPRPNQRFDPWARDRARKAIDEIEAGPPRAES